MRCRGVMIVAAMLLAGLGSQAALSDGTKTAGPASRPTSQPTTSQPADPDHIVVEVERFDLEEATVENLRGAGGGKAVLFRRDTAAADYTIPSMPKGRYAVTVFTQAPDADRDAFLLIMAAEVYRLFPAEFGSVQPTTQNVEVEIEKTGPCRVLLLAAEPGVYVDRIEFRRR